MAGKEKVQWYRLEWDVAEGEGTIVLVLAGVEKELIGLSAEEFHVLSTMLRNERPIFWDDQTQVISTANEIVGEEEMD